MKQVRSSKGLHEMKHDEVTRPKHYVQNKSGIEVIDISKKFDFCNGNVVKYIARHQHKGTPVADLKKALQYWEWSVMPTMTTETRYNLEVFASCAPNPDRSLLNIFVRDWWYLGAALRKTIKELEDAEL